jgi:hypothetical protein
VIQTPRCPACGVVSTSGKEWALTGRSPSWGRTLRRVRGLYTDLDNIAYSGCHPAGLIPFTPSYWDVHDRPIADDGRASPASAAVKRLGLAREAAESGGDGQSLARPRGRADHRRQKDRVRRPR